MKTCFRRQRRRSAAHQAPERTHLIPVEVRDLEDPLDVLLSRSGAGLDDPRVRTALGIAPGERLIVLVQLGRPAEQPAPKPRLASAELTTWLP